ncbi:DASH complex subunit Dad2-domain-containing protein [Aspergillus caelatus]|uniref:DASH complex subunit DAD2 n=2 Tax=Aspergillus subgen. Circumdati TaxID=2720871 RepID=A0A5N7AA13_9EURO|nr:DASH complex subunit Dad2-domain-containing protein [Aspergillus caelatus]KAE8366662.1 DASH complex subunit Dad2-domain-containing protein [Aspergillus caelatus]KAE8412220.1 DASH complex subunit Dad2-domain-containing protein [Aspergillus pseudocaelatus]
MTYMSRPTPMLPSMSSTGSSFRQPNTHHAAPQQQSSALAARIASKKAELDNLKQLRDMSCALAMQMQVLEEKIGTLKDGTEAVACVLANWDNVLRSISMASTEAVTVQRPITQNPNTLSEDDKTGDSPMPATLVRIPADQAAMAGE